MNGRDRGWKPLLKILAMGFMPWKARRWLPEFNKLLQIRGIWLSLVISLLSYLIVLSFIAPWNGEAGPFPWVVAGVGVAALVGIYLLRRQSLRGATPETILKSFNERFFQSFALSETPALLGFVSVFLRDVRWLYVVGASFALVGMLLCGPLRQNIDHYDRMLRASGSPLRLSDLLLQPISQPQEREEPPSPPPVPGA